MKGSDLYKLKKNIQKYKHIFYLKEKFQSELLASKGQNQNQLAKVLDVSFSDFVMDKLNKPIVNQVEYKLIQEAIEAKNKLFEKLELLQSHSGAKKHKSSLENVINRRINRSEEIEEEKKQPRHHTDRNLLEQINAEMF